MSIALIVGQLTLMFIDRNAGLPSGFESGSGQWNLSNVMNDVVNLGVPILGILLASRLPRNAIGWLLLTAAVLLGIGGFAASYALHAIVAVPGSLPLPLPFAWISNWIGLISLGILCFLFLLFPTGHVLGPRWRWAARYVVVVFGLGSITFMTFATIGWSHPFRNDGGSYPAIGVTLFGSVLVALGLSVACVVVRYRRSVGDERLQLKWFAAGAAVVLLTQIAGFGSTTPTLVLVLPSLAFIFLFVTIGIAILKYRLYDIDS